VLLATSTSSSWTYADNLPGFRLEHIYSCGDGHLWALADYEKDYGLFESSDLGVTWTIKTPHSLIKPSQVARGWSGSNHDAAIYFVNSRVGWIVTHSPGPNPVFYVYSTTDAGGSWRTSHFRLPAASGGDQTFTSFSDEKHGAILFVGEFGEGRLDKFIFTTSDGGDEWMLRSDTSSQADVSHLPKNDSPTGIACASASTIWISEFCQNDKTLAPLFKSEDSGSDWHTQVLDIPKKLLTSYTNVYAPHFFGKGSQSGVLAAQYVSNDLLTTEVQLFGTSNAGASWQPTPLLRVPDGTSTLDWCSFDRERIWIIDGDGNVQYTSDGGASWTKYNPNVSFRMPSSNLEVYAVSAQDLVVLRTGSELVNKKLYFTSTLFESVDEGQKWRQSFDISQLIPFTNE
jgi:photosystem II stability/assembly factor-like uncharacterized protein